MPTVIDQLSELFDTIGEFITGIYYNAGTGFMPYALALFTLLFFIPVFCAVIRRVFNG